MSWVNEVKDWIPEYAKDIRLNLDAVVNRSTLDEDTVKGVCLASTFAAGNTTLVNKIASYCSEEVKTAALTAGSLMAMTNMWYPYVEMTSDPALKGLQIDEAFQWFFENIFTYFLMPFSDSFLVDFIIALNN